jgi:hypothetical protein
MAEPQPDNIGARVGAADKPVARSARQSGGKMLFEHFGAVNFQELVFKQ